MKLLPFDFAILNDDLRILVNPAGESCFLNDKTFRILCNEDYEWLPSSCLLELKAKHFITEDENLPLTIELLANKLRSRKAYLDSFTALHMIVVTLRCNCACKYCHAPSKGNNKDNLYDMDEETAYRTVDFIMQTPSKSIKIEFQGGEPMLNYPIVEKIILYAEKLNKKLKKELSFVICTNLLAISQEQIKFFYNHKVSISTSCDGQKDLHDECRKSLISDSAYDSFFENMLQVRRICGKGEPSALLTITRRNISSIESIIDLYRDLGFNNIFIRALNPYGYAVENKDELSYTVDEFIDAYDKALKYIINLNLQGTYFVEAYAAMFLQRIMTPFPTGFVDLQSPCGAGLLGAIYYYNGDVYPADEGRMLAASGDKHFLMGNVKTSNYRDVFDGRVIKELVKNSCVENMAGCSYCAYKQFCGADPIRYYVECGNIYGKRYASDFCKKNQAIIKILLRYVHENDRNIMKVFWSWLTRKAL